MNLHCLPSSTSLVSLITLHPAVLLPWPHVLVQMFVLSVWSCVCLVQFSLQFLPVCLFVDEGAEDQVGPLHRFPSHEPATSGERRRLLAPSISVSVPDDDPSHSDEEYYEHPLFSSQWTASSVRPSVPAQSAEAHLGQEKGEPSMVPVSASSQPAALTTCITLSVPPCAGGRGRSLFFPYESEVPISLLSIQMPQQYLWKKSDLRHVSASLFSSWLQAEKEAKKVQTKYDFFLLLANISIRKECIFLPKPKKMTLNIIFPYY